MARPSLKDERRASILEAYGRCVARFGVEGATLERTAEEAGLARALIRHNVGNKEELFDALVGRFMEQAADSSAQLFDSLPDDDRLTTLIDWLFDTRNSDPYVVSLTNALITAAIDRPELARLLRRSTEEFAMQLGTEVKAAFPNADSDEIDAVANGIAAIYFNLDTMTPLGRVSKLRRSSQLAAQLLLSSLEH